MPGTSTPDPSATPLRPAHTLRSIARTLWFQVAIAAALALVTAFAIAADYTAHHITPVLRGRVVATLAARFHSPVTLDTFDVSLLNGIRVHGTGLRILYLAGPTVPDKAAIDPTLRPPAGNPSVPPMLEVRSFTFRTSLRDLIRLRTRIGTVYVQGLVLRIPPHQGHNLLGGDKPHAQPLASLLVDRILVHDAQVIIETNQSGKLPLEFNIQNLNLQDVGTRLPFRYTADLINPKPVGAIHATGNFGPWHGDDPRATAIDGDYTFTHADLSTINGIAGTLNSSGHLSGVLGHIEVDGSTYTPDFSLDISDHPEPLTTTFHAIVDGTTGDTTLQPVHAVLAQSAFTCTGTIAKMPAQNGRPAGHDIALLVDMPHGRIQDLLQLAMKSQPAVMRGTVQMHAHLHIPPGRERVAQKIGLDGHVSIDHVEFTNTGLQDHIDGLSMRAQGKPEQARLASTDHKAEVASNMQVDFSLDHSLIQVTHLTYSLPGAQILMQGAYTMHGEAYLFTGHLRTQATASQMLTGWKSLLLKPLDPLLEHNGAGVQLPIEVHGDHNKPSFGLALHGSNDTAALLAAQLQSQHPAAH